MLNWVKRNVFNVLIWGVVVFFTLLYFSLIFNHNIWTDEAFTLQLLKNDIVGIVEGTAIDVHPPLYYFYAKIFYVIGNGNLQLQKIAAIIPMTLTLVFGATVVRKKFGDMASFLFVLLLGCVPCSMEFAVQVRMYSLALLFVTVAGVYAYLAFTENQISQWVIYALACVGAAYTHYFAFVSVLFVSGFLFLAVLFTKRKLLKRWLIAVVCMLISYIPWIGAFISQIQRVRADYWIPPITAETIWGYFTWMFGTQLIPVTVYGFILLLVAALVFCIVAIVRRKDGVDFFALLSLLVPFCTMIFGVLISLSESPIYREQYIFPAMGLMLLAVAISLRKLNWKLLLPVFAFLLLVGALQYKEVFHQEYNSTYIKETDAFFEEHLGPNDYIVYNWELFDFIYACYFPEVQLFFYEDFDFTSDFETVWYINTATEWQYPQDDLIQLGLSCEWIGHYGIEHNEFDIYMIFENLYEDE